MEPSRRTALDNVYGVLLFPYKIPHANDRPPPPWIRPFRRAAKAALSVARYGWRVSRHQSVGLAQQTRMLTRRLAEGFSVDDFYRYRLYRQPDETLFVPTQANYEIRMNFYDRLSEKLGIDPDVLADKRRFATAAADAGLPVAEMVADFSDGVIHWWKGDSLPAADLFAKEAHAMCGQGAMAWSWNGSRWVAHQTGASHDEHSLLSRLVELSKEAPYVLQRRLSNHPAIVDLSPVGLCTVRAVTVRSLSGGPSRILLSSFRIPKHGDIADNFARGGLACTIDERTGVLGIGVLKDVQHAHLDLERHPDNGAQITGRTLPCWDEVKELALRAHDAFPQFPSIGWDVAITDRGPLLLEANYNWDSVLAQQVGCCPLGATEWPEDVLEWVQVGLPEPSPAPIVERATA